MNMYLFLLLVEFVWNECRILSYPIEGMSQLKIPPMIKKIYQIVQTVILNSIVSHLLLLDNHRPLYYILNTRVLIASKEMF